MIKKEKDKKVRLGIRCGDCVHYDKLKKFDDVCVKLGVREKANAPDCFSPDVYRLNSTKNPDVFGELATVIKKLRPSQKRILAFTLTKSSTTLEKHGVYFGQTVYFSLGADYLSHYFKGYVIGADADSVIVSSRLKNCDTNTVGYFLPETLLSRKKFKTKKKELTKSNRLIMKDMDKAIMKSLPLAELIDSKGRWINWKPEASEDDFDYEPPTLDTAPPEWFDKTQRKTKKAKKHAGYIPITNIEDIPVKGKYKDGPTLKTSKNKMFSYDSSKRAKK